MTLVEIERDVYPALSRRTALAIDAFWVSYKATHPSADEGSFLEGCRIQAAQDVWMINELGKVMAPRPAGAA